MRKMQSRMHWVIRRSLMVASVLTLTGRVHAQSTTTEDDADLEIPAAKDSPPPDAPAPTPTLPQRPVAAPIPDSPPPAATTQPGQPGDGELLNKRIEETEKRLAARVAALEAQLAKPIRPNPPAIANPAAPRVGNPARPGEQFSFRLPGGGAWALSGYVQAQYESHQDSEDQIQQGGSLLNQDRFLVRRGRLRFDAAWQWAELALEIDGSTTRGPIFGIRRAEASLLYRGRKFDGTVTVRGEQRDVLPPIAMLTAGLTEVPFGFELTDSSRNRHFMERSAASLAFFPGEPDVGVRLSGGIGFFRYAVAVLNGEPLDDRTTSRPARDPNAAKDIVARLGAEGKVTPSFRLSGGVSALRGTGFHAGTEATKNRAEWRDLNENNSIDTGEVIAVPGSAATPSENFTRWAAALDVQARVQTPLGQTMIYGEALAATNLDRGFFIADPVVSGVDIRHLSFYAAVVQDVKNYGFVGVRFDYYDPNADFFDSRAGKLIPTSQAVTTISPLVGLQIPGLARLSFQYDVVQDALGRDERGVPADLRNDRWTIRLQVQR
jgi:hypothetical protein